MDLETLVDETDWWLYVIVVCILFFIILALNYCVKKLNESRLDQKAIKTQKKTPHQSVQFEDKEVRPSIRTPPDNPDNLAKISLVFDKERKVRMSEAIIEKTESSLAHNSAPLLNDPANQSLSSHPTKSTDSIKKQKPTFLGEIYQIQSKDSEIDTIVKNKIVFDKLKSKEKPETVEDTAKIPNKCCEAAVKLIESIIQEQIKDAMANVIFKTSNDDEMSSKVEQNIPNIEKLEEKKNINNKVTSNNTSNDNSKVEQNKTNIEKLDEKKNINEKTWKSCNDNSNKEPNIDKVEQNIDKNVKSETFELVAANLRPEMEHNKDYVEYNEINDKDNRPKTSDSQSDDTDSRKPEF